MEDATEDRREVLLAAATDWVLEHGLGALTLRPLAAALGTSDRMLVYHFGGKDRLVDDIIVAVNGRLMRALPPIPEAGGAHSGPRPSEGVLAVWRQVSAPAAAPYLRFLAEMTALGVRNPQRFAAPVRAVLDTWLARIPGLLEATPAADREALAAAVVAALYALAVDVQLLGESALPDAAIAELARLLDP